MWLIVVTFGLAEHIWAKLSHICFAIALELEGFFWGWQYVLRYMVQMTAHKWEPYMAWLRHTMECVNLWLTFGFCLEKHIIVMYGGLGAVHISAYSTMLLVALCLPLFPSEIYQQPWCFQCFSQYENIFSKSVHLLSAIMYACYTGASQ